MMIINLLCYCLDSLAKLSCEYYSFVGCYEPQKPEKLKKKKSHI